MFKMLQSWKKMLKWKEEIIKNNELYDFNKIIPKLRKYFWKVL